MTLATRLVGAVVVGLLAGCGGPAADETSAESERGGPSTVSGTVTVLAAASLTEAFTTLGRRFERDHPGARVRFSFAASSELATQAVGGAPADVFASASAATMDQVVRAGAVRGAPAVFARNRLAIAVPRENPGRVTGLADFADEDLTIALCAPEVPCGAAAEKLFTATGITPSADTYEADVKATLTKVVLGEVDAALVYRTDVLAAGDAVRGIAVPEAAAAANRYPMAVLARGPNPRAAREFVELVQSRYGQQVLRAAGFERP